MVPSQPCPTTARAVCFGGWGAAWEQAEMGAWERRRRPLGTLEQGQLLLPGSNSRSALRLVPRAKAGGLPGREWAGWGACAFF